MDKQLIAEAHDKVQEVIAVCNRAARNLLAETAPFAGKNAEKILAANSDRLMSLAMDLVDMRSKLAEAVAEYDGLKRRAQ